MLCEKPEFFLLQFLRQKWVKIEKFYLVPRIFIKQFYSSSPKLKNYCTRANMVYKLCTIKNNVLPQYYNSQTSIQATLKLLHIIPTQTYCNIIHMDPSSKGDPCYFKVNLLHLKDIIFMALLPPMVCPPTLPSLSVLHLRKF